MRYLLTCIAFGISTCNVAAQNLVPNPSFEDTVNCPMGVDQVYNAEHWMSFRDSPEYFHGCDNNINGIVGVPGNFLCYQPANSGSAYGGLLAYDLTGAPYREYLAVKLNENTQVNKQYTATFYVSFAGTIGFTIAVNKLGISLTNGLYSSTNPYPITNSPLAYDDSIYTDTLGWSKISLSFIADSAYQYLIIGNFFDDQNTDTLHLGEFNSHSYYLIDDVCLSKSENSCDKNTDADVLDSPSALIVIPNPASDALHLQSEGVISPIRIWDVLGRPIFSTNDYVGKDLTINCGLWANGTYIIAVNATIKKIIVQH